MYRNICILTLFLNVTLFAGFSDPDKQKKWDEMEMQINQTVDGLEMPIDPIFIHFQDTLRLQDRLQRQDMIG